MSTERGARPPPHRSAALGIAEKRCEEPRKTKVGHVPLRNLAL
jgi:hypothetical protein